MKIGNFNLDKDILIVAEIGNNHEGSYSLAEEMIGLASEAGVGAVKFQTFQTEHYVSQNDQKRFNKLKSFELTYKEFENLNKVANQSGLIFLSTPFDLESAKFLNTIAPAFKISSGDNNFYPLLETVAQFGKPIILSGGLSELGQLRYAKSLIQKVWDDLKIKQNLAILHCVSSYPVPYEEANLSVISRLKKYLQCIIGYSDHTIGIEAATLSAALGARIIEKHFTIDKNYSDFRDHQLSADPEEMAQLVKKIHQIKILMGSGKKIIQPSEEVAAFAVRRSIAANRNLPTGTIINWDDLTWVRPADGLPPGKESLVVGKTLSKHLNMGEPITLDVLCEKGMKE